MSVCVHVSVCVFQVLPMPDMKVQLLPPSPEKNWTSLNTQLEVVLWSDMLIPYKVVGTHC